MTKGVLTDRSHPRRVEILFSLQKEEGDEEEFGNVDKGQLSKDSGGRIVICSFFQIPWLSGGLTAAAGVPTYYDSFDSSHPLY